MKRKRITIRKKKTIKDYTRQKMIFFGILVLGILGVAAFAPWLTPYDPYAQDLGSALQPPNAKHLLGTDRYGRDMLSHCSRGF